MKRAGPLGTAFLLCLLLTVASGTMFRSLMAGLDWGAISALDWRRAHSHLGFYGVMFPAAWFCLSLSGRWSPRGRWLAFYYVLVAVSVAGFLHAGYGFVATAASTLILAFWVYSAWRNRAVPALRRGGPAQAVPLNMIFAAACVPAIAVASKQAPELVFPFVRLFMTQLLFGVFVPSMLSGSDARDAWPLAWVVFPALGALHASELVDGPFVRLGAFGFGLLLVVTVIGLVRLERAFSPRLAAQWLIFAGGYLLRIAGVLPAAQTIMIAGLHFLLLGPLLLTLFEVRLRWELPTKPLLLYHAAVATMVGAVFAQQWFYEWISRLQWLATAGGAAIVVSLVWLIHRASVTAPANAGA